jgi:uncharacterized protein YegL
MTDIRGQLLPVYVLADESGSMEFHVGELNAGLDSLHQSLLGEPTVSAKVRFSVIGFNNGVTPRLQLADLRMTGTMPQLSAWGGTSYQAAFTDLLTRIPGDVATLKGQGYRVHRPAVFFLSDGQPNPEDWRTPHAQLTNRAVTPTAPNIIACGIGTADAATILAVATNPDYAFVAIKGVDVGVSIAKFCTALTQSIIQSVSSLDSGQPELKMDKPTGFTMAIDEV